jgi:hypothetical protein
MLALATVAATTARLYSFDDSFREDLDGFIDRCIALWETTGTHPPQLSVRYERSQQRNNERKFDLLIDLVERQLRGFPDSVLGRDRWRRNILTSVKQICTASLGLPEVYLNILFSGEYTKVTRDFVHQARQFDPAIELADLGQAMRNVWVTNYLQMLLDLKPSLNPAVFAYSMLYPYTDNYLDRPEISPHSKAAFNRRFGLRLGGAALLPLERHEKQVFQLIEIIENKYSRSAFPEVYQSLLAIHNGQVRSLEQQGASCPLDLSRILRISIEKGGASVLADGYLIDGKLTRAEADFFFGFGVLLQLQDDLQDLQQDRCSQRWTIFSRIAEETRLDAVTSRLCHFMGSVLERSGRFSDARYATLKELIGNNCLVLMLQSIAINSSHYSRDYLRYMESFSPLSFSYLRKLRPRLEKRHAGVLASFRRRSSPISVYDLLG